MNIAIIVFAGKGTRIGSEIPKQFIKINGVDLVAYTINAFNSHPLIDEIVLVTSKEYLSYVKSFKHNYSLKKVSLVIQGGETRQESVRNALNKIIATDSDYVFIHDGDRPLISQELITTCIRETLNGKNVVPIINKSEQIKNISNSGRVIEINNEVFDVQTPQCFSFNLIKEAHNTYNAEEVSDDASLIEKLGKQITYIKGESENFKITQPSDLNYFQRLVK
ncbi:MAG: 2-C-methyl-D-erythritol 4-phosphate cytidylyltransferase [Bacilli bacterium]|nr:2-C-methyl-D-erythritol 4-phosphate cytidylyltransferase [Bacilli bacterium]